MESIEIKKELQELKRTAYTEQASTMLNKKHKYFIYRYIL